MKKKKIKFILAAFIIILISIGIFKASSPIREFSTFPEYQGKNEFLDTRPQHDASKKTVVLIADNEGTEIFDLLAPFYLFSETEKANVYIVAQKKSPITAMKGLFLLPHFSYAELEKTEIKPDVIVIPNLSAMNAENQDPEIIDWIKSNYSTQTKILAVCDGSLTAAETGLYDNKPLTTHASDLEMMKKENGRPIWVRGLSVTKSHNLYSTAGVSNAVEGSLVVIRDLFGEETMQKVKKQIHYPYYQPKIEHNSEVLTFKNKLGILKKVFFTGNKHIGVLLQEDVNELELAGVMDTYYRVFPKSIKSFVAQGTSVTTRNGLVLLPTGDLESSQPDELHVMNSDRFYPETSELLGNPEVIFYNDRKGEYIFDYSLGRIDSLYGKDYSHIVKLLLDYN